MVEGTHVGRDISLRGSRSVFGIQLRQVLGINMCTKHTRKNFVTIPTNYAKWPLARSKLLLPQVAISNSCKQSSKFE